VNSLAAQSVAHLGLVIVGLGGTVATSAGGGRSTFATHQGTPNGRRVSKFEIWYRARPNGGRLRLKVDGGEPEFIATSAQQAIFRIAAR